MQPSNIKPHRGKIVDFLKSPFDQITGYRIRENGVDYIAHLGDINTTENLLYALRDHKGPPVLELETLDKGDEVEFEPFGEKNAVKHAIHVKKVG